MDALESLLVSLIPFIIPAVLCASFLVNHRTPLPKSDKQGKSSKGGTKTESTEGKKDGKDKVVASSPPPTALPESDASSTKEQ